MKGAIRKGRSNDRGTKHTQTYLVVIMHISPRHRSITRKRTVATGSNLIIRCLRLVTDSMTTTLPPKSTGFTKSPKAKLVIPGRWLAHQILLHAPTTALRQSGHEMINSSPIPSTVIVDPSGYLPDSRAMATGSPTIFCITRFKGLAPKAGS